jgi:hypothetical protein
MKLKGLGPALLAAIALLAFTASSATATTLEVASVKQNASVTIKFSLKSGTSALLTDTVGTFSNTVTASNIEMHTETFTGTAVGGKVTSWTWIGSESLTVDEFGTLSIENIAGTTNGTVRSSGLKLTGSSPLGALTCVTSNTDIGVLTGVSGGSATLDVNAVLNCGAVTLKWSGTYIVTSPSGLGVTS